MQARAQSRAVRDRAVSYVRKAPGRRLRGLPSRIAHAAVYLASEEADFVHGSLLDVDGGRTSVAVFGG